MYIAINDANTDTIDKRVCKNYLRVMYTLLRCAVITKLAVELMRLLAISVAERSYSM